MNIAIISPEYSTYSNWGGIATYNRSLIELLTKLGHNVFLFTYGEDNYVEVNRKRNGVKTTIIYVARKPRKKLLALFYSSIPIQLIRSTLDKMIPYTFFALEWNLFTLFAFRQIVKETKIDLIHSTTPHAPGIFVNFFYRHIPVVSHSPATQKFLNKYRPKTIDNRLKSFINDSYLLKIPDKIIACSPSEQSILSREFSTIKQKVVFIPNFIDRIENFRNNENVDRNNIVYFGRIEYRKGVDILLNSFSELAVNNKNLKLFIVGDNTKSFRTKNQFEDFFGLLKSLDIPESIRNRIYIIPGISDKKFLFLVLKSIKGIAVFPARYEPFGYVVIEAMAMGYPVIVSSKVGSSYIIKDGDNGIVSHPNSDHIKAAISKCIKLPKRELHKIGEQAQLTIKNNFILGSVKEDYLTIYRSLGLVK